MSEFTLGTEAVYAVQRCSRELTKSVWSVRFYDYLLDVLQNDTWKEYRTEAFARPCRFKDVKEFLAHEDGLGWPSIAEVRRMIEIVASCIKELPPEKNAPPGPPLQRRAQKVLAELDRAGVVSTPAGETYAADWLPLESPQFAQAGDNQYTLKDGGDNVTTRANDTAKGNSAAYLAARLKKAERNDLLAEIGPGKRFKSVRAAAIEAGIIRPVPTIRLVDDACKVASSLAKHLDRDQIQTLIVHLQQTIQP
jgi:hypothetical protein